MSSTLNLKTRQLSTFLQQYVLEKKTLILANKKGGASLRAGTDNDDIPVLIKTWPRVPGTDDSDVRDIWRNEIRQLHRLTGHPGASDYIVELRTTHEDETGFYLVLNPDQRRPLDKLLGDEESNGRRSIPAVLRDRRVLWRNLRRIALGLEILHSQGLLHRNLSTWSVLTAATNEPDFQLTGFEWSMRLVSSDDKPGSRKADAQRLEGHSFIRDWQDFGQLAVLLLGLNAKIKNRAIPNHEVTATVTIEEIKFVRQLLQITPTELVDGHFVVMRIDEILTVLDAHTRNKEPRFSLVVSLGQQSPLARKIREASGGEIELDDSVSQREFVEADLFNPILISERVIGFPDQFNLVLRGQHLSYQLQDYTFGPEKTSSNWDAAACFRADLTMPLFFKIIKTMPLSFKAINLMTPSEMKANTHRIRERFTSWDELRKHLHPVTPSAGKEKLLRKSFALTQMLEYLFSASELFRVEIVKLPANFVIDQAHQNILAVRPRPDENRDRLSLALGLRDVLAVRLERALLEDRTEHDESRIQSWRLTDSSILGGRSESKTEWKFHTTVTASTGETLYIFFGDQPAPTVAEAFLISEDSVGTHEQFLRRMKSFKALAEHGELARMLVDPRSRVMHIVEASPSSAQFLELDASKQDAFKATIETMPLFLIQGPPGVGKTRLVRELVRYSISEDSSARILLSAQSNHAVDHLLHEMEEFVDQPADVKPLVVRCRAGGKKDELSPFDIGQQTKRFVSDLMKSDLYAESSSQIRRQIDQLGTSYGLDGSEENWDSLPPISKSSRRALEGLVLRAANMVFATTNSSDLGRLIEEKGQFDWSIVEEAGKATGGELISPLLLSHRRLMIGDHKQLPPFGAERLLALLAKPKGVKSALKLGDPLIGRMFRDTTIDEIFSDVEADESPAGEQSFAELCNKASRAFSLFETIIEDEFERQELRKSGRPIALPLIAQHRMHPAIATVVSNAFYETRLYTDKDSAEKFRTEEAPIISLDPGKLPDCPIVWIDMPFVQGTMHMKFGEALPKYSNDLELEAVEAVLKLLAASPGVKKPPSLAILSPYSRQVSKLNGITEAGSQLPAALRQFTRAAKQKTFCSTVDSFQGSEADCVVISLVRNNNLGNVSSGLGFLADPRRMNVLLSRARWKLIIVGSLSFLKKIDKTPKSAEEAIRTKFLEILLSVVTPSTPNENIRVVSYSDLIGKLI
ncbi:AAA domain-containing protein [Glaciimonas sp. PCH181]|uniref:AAA domain-containing protein n=1 Tax=Glaciimonas sp. PCH181 TaxID=2133943 RepID=UPI000D393837|nr:AAA domain-containing protein [Glaciimonas sp. PCH181]PUA17644.1 hypothetical protein C7W93_17335 [Glaciimonas sp. PCH181]